MYMYANTYVCMYLQKLHKHEEKIGLYQLEVRSGEEKEKRGERSQLEKRKKFH